MIANYVLYIKNLSMTNESDDAAYILFNQVFYFLFRFLLIKHKLYNI